MVSGHVFKHKQMYLSPVFKTRQCYQNIRLDIRKGEGYVTILKQNIIVEFLNNQTGMFYKITSHKCHRTFQSNFVIFSLNLTNHRNKMINKFVLKDIFHHRLGCLRITFFFLFFFQSCGYCKQQLVFFVCIIFVALFVRPF